MSMVGIIPYLFFSFFTSVAAYFVRSPSDNENLEQKSEQYLLVIKIKSKNINSVRKFVNSLKLLDMDIAGEALEGLALHQEFRETGNRKGFRV